MSFSLGNRGRGAPGPGPGGRGRAGLARGLVAGLAGVAGLAACSGEEDGGGFQKPPPTVEVMRVEPQLLRDTAKFGGQLEAEKSVMLKSEVDGVVASIDFAEGQRAEEGQVLIRLRSGEERARLEEARAQLALAREEERRTRQLLERSAVARAQQDKVVAELGVARARVELARVNLEQTRIRAPFDGVVGMQLVHPGDLVTDQDPLVQVAAVDRLQALFPMSDIVLPFARVGVPVEITVAPYPGERFPGEVFFISPTLNPETRRIMAKAWVPNGEGRLAAGLYVDVEVEIARREDAIIVPESAVVADRHGTFVWRLGGDDVARRVPVEVGLRKNGRVEISMGLRPGDRIVAAGTHKVVDGKQVATVATPLGGQASAPLEERLGAGEGT